jgi:hypothetical protein
MTTDNPDSNIYFIDAGALVTIFRAYPGDLLEPVWGPMEEMFQKGRMFSHRFVYDEIATDAKRPDLLSKKIAPLQACFRPATFEQAQIVSNIIKRFPGLIDPKNEKEQAEPWLIAAGVLEQRQLSLFNPNKKIHIVSEDGRTDVNRISSACMGYGLGHLTLSGLFEITPG